MSRRSKNSGAYPAKWTAPVAAPEGAGGGGAALEARAGTLLRGARELRGLDLAARARVEVRLGTRRAGRAQIDSPPAAAGRTRVRRIAWAVAVAVLVTGSVVATARVDRGWLDWLRRDGAAGGPRVSGEAASPAVRPRAARRPTKVASAEVAGEPAVAAALDSTAAAASPSPPASASALAAPVVPVPVPAAEPVRKKLVRAAEVSAVPPTPPPAQVAPSPFLVETDGSIDEARALAPVLAALRSGAPDRALDALGAYERRFPRGELAEEAFALRIDGWLALGRAREALAMLDRAAPTPIEGRPRATELRLLRAELRADADRCPEALEDLAAGPIAISGDGAARAAAIRRRCAVAAPSGAPGERSQ